MNNKLLKKETAGWEQFKRDAGWEQFKKLLENSPAFQLTQALKGEYLALPFVYKVACLPNLLVATLLIAYYNKETAMIPKEVANDQAAAYSGKDNSKLNSETLLASESSTGALKASSPEKEIQAGSEPGRGPEASNASPGQPGERANSLERGGNRMREFLQAAQELSPLYVILPLLFMTGLTLLNQWAKVSLSRSPDWRTVWNSCYSSISGRLRDPRGIRDFTLDFRPLFLTWFCLVPPITITMMAYVAMKTFIGYLRPARAESGGMEQRYGQSCLVLRQNVEDLMRHPKNFYSSGWFNTIMALPFIMGVPAAISLWIYFNLGIDGLLDYPSQDPRFFTTFVIIGLYLCGLGSCLCLLFFRSYFSFAWNFNSAEYDLEIYPDMIKKLPIKGWFYDFLTLAERQLPVEIRWNEVQAIKFSSGKLKTDNSRRSNPVLSVLQKVTTIFESIARKMDINPDYLEITGTAGRSINIQLWELSQQQKIDLFQSLRTYWPSGYLDEAVQRALVGSSVLREPRYTQIWFAVLSSNSESIGQGDLEYSCELQNKKYRVTAKIASGGQAVIYEAETATGQTVVLKEFRLTCDESLDTKIESARDFENESAILSQLDHDSIVKMQDMFYEDGRVYLVLESVKGKTLRQVIEEEGPMQQDLIADLARQMCSILDYVHGLQPPVVHRDFTPDNLILQPDGKIKLIDFSVAQRKEKKMKSADCAGKHSYTPPEQFGGNACPQSDLYAFGATLYFLATGKDAEPISRSQLPATLAKDMPVINDVIGRATELNLSERYSAAKLIIIDLGQLEKSQCTNSEGGNQDATDASDDASDDASETIKLEESALLERNI